MLGDSFLGLAQDGWTEFAEQLTFQMIYDMGVSKNRGTPKWMVYNGKPY